MLSAFITPPCCSPSARLIRAESVLAAVSMSDATARPARLATALHRLIAAVKRQPAPAAPAPELATEFLADSYYEQSRALPGVSLKAALDLARKAAAASPQSGFAWARVAELEFGFGNTGPALEALEKSLALAPRNAEALSLKGFLIAAQNRPAEAIAWFDRALAVDSALGNAWLGRGLCRIRRGDAQGGREDLLVAAALEPQRAELRSYLGKAYANAGDVPRAEKELALAEKIDPNDPTAWLYSALLNQSGNRINEAVHDLEKSADLNDNRRVYRSQFLLDEDRAVRGANLAGVYEDAGMFDVSQREAARAVNQDYANYAAHLFLANSYNELRDPNDINLRYETPSEAEFLVANLLSPGGVGTLSPTISEGEYARLFEHDGFGVASSTEYLSRGAWTQSGAQYGVFGNFSYDFEAFYRTDPGQRINNDIDQRQLSLNLKQQLTPQDSVFLRIQQYNGESGDVFQYYDQNMANGTARVMEKQEPIIGIGYHREWAPGVHTLFYATRLEDTLAVTNQTQPGILSFTEGLPGATILDSVQGFTTHAQYDAGLTIYSSELQQIFEGPQHTTVFGGRFQYGHFNTANLQNQTSLGGAFPDPPLPAADQDITTLFKRISLYGYHQWQILEPLQLIGGVAYDRITYPDNFQNVPISTSQKTADSVSPKAGIIWTPARDTTLRFAYTRSLAGASLDQSSQLEPSQVAGFVQSFRSIIPESVVGPTAGAEFETYGISLEQKFPTGTYLGLSGEILNSDIKRTTGSFDFLTDQFDFAMPASQNEHLDYGEKSLQFTANQLLGREWSLGAKYRLSEAILHDNFVDIPDGVLFGNFTPRQRLEGVLQQLDLTAIYNHPSGFFAQGEALWYSQNNRGYSTAEPGDAFWQLNVLAGFRTRGRNAEASIGLLNLNNHNYYLNPLNAYNELPRSRTLAVRVKLNF